MRTILLCAFLLLSPAAQAAERILALTPHVCEMMFAIGAGNEVVGAGEYCDYPEAVSSLPKVANHRQVYVEAALRLKPTLAVGLRSNLPGIEHLKSEGVRIIASNPLTVGAVFEDMLRLGKFTGHTGEAEAAVAHLRQRLRALQMEQSEANLRVFYEIWHEPLMAAGGASLIHSALCELGLENVFAGIPFEGPRVSVEAVLLARPDIIILPSESNVDARKRFWRKWFGKYPVTFVVANADLLHRPGPRQVEGMEELQAALRAALRD